MGRKFRDDAVQADKKLWPFEVVPKDGKPVVQVAGEELRAERIHLATPSSGCAPQTLCSAVPDTSEGECGGHNNQFSLITDGKLRIFIKKS